MYIQPMSSLSCNDVKGCENDGRTYSIEYEVRDITVSHMVELEGFTLHAPPYAFAEPVAIIIDTYRASDLPAGLTAPACRAGQSKPLSNDTHVSKWRFAGNIVSLNPDGIQPKGVVITFAVDPRNKTSDEILTIITLNVEVRVFKSHSQISYLYTIC